jgi:hypothetical protein
METLRRGNLMREGFTGLGGASVVGVAMEVSGGAIDVVESSAAARTRAVPETKTAHAVMEAKAILRTQKDIGSNVSVCQNQS